MIIVLQHSDKGGPGRLGATLRDHGFRVDIRRPDREGLAALPPDLDEVEGLVILGGPQNVTDVAKYDWMQREVELVKAAHAAELPVIGICLGAQLIAHSLGGTVGFREKPAVGFYRMSINTTGQIEPMLAGMPWDSMQVFSCGQEIKTLPPGAALLAGTKQTPVQIFRAGLRTFAFMCHFECDRAMVDGLMQECSGQMQQCHTTPGEVKVQADQEYDRYARISDRLCVNLATLCFPLERRVMAGR